MVQFIKYPDFRHELSEEAGLTALSFGQEGVERYIMVFKKEYPPSEDELTVLRSGEEWTAEKEKEMAAEVSGMNFQLMLTPFSCEKNNLFCCRGSAKN